MNEIIQIEHLEKTFGNHEVLKDVHFTVNEGEVVTIIGSSGSGKSTLLRCINLFEEPTSGRILYHGEDIINTKNPTKYRQKVGMVFQSFNLFNNMNVLKNCSVGPIKVQKKSKQEAEELAKKYLSVVGMDVYINAKPAQLSGGQNRESRSPAPLPCNPKSFCSTNRLLRSIPKW